jgi:hypothetical protein
LIHEVRMLSGLIQFTLIVDTSIHIIYYVGPNDPWQCLEFIVDVGSCTIAELKLQVNSVVLAVVIIHRYFFYIVVEFGITFRS